MIGGELQCPLVTMHTVKPDKLVQLKLFEETDCLELFKFTNSNKLSTSNYFM